MASGKSVVAAVPTIQDFGPWKVSCELEQKKNHSGKITGSIYRFKLQMVQNITPVKSVPSYTVPSIVTVFEAVVPNPDFMARVHEMINSEMVGSVDIGETGLQLVFSRSRATFVDYAGNKYKFDKEWHESELTV
jgi:hypothetical protein